MVFDEALLIRVANSNPDLAFLMSNRELAEHILI
jgi:hypothetical protein